MGVNIRSFGSVHGREAHLITISNAAGTALTVTEVGASVTSLVYAGTDVVLGWNSPELYARTNECMGSTVGRIANRTAGAAFTLHGKRYTLAANEGRNNLHSAPDGFQTRFWTVEKAEDNAVAFFMDSPDGDQGFPGRFRLHAVYSLTEDDEVHIRYYGESDADTPVNIINHAYFNLNGHASGSAMGHLLRVNAEAFTPSDAETIPTGEIVGVEGTPFDFRETHAIGRDVDEPHPQLLMARGYDHNYVLPGSGLRTAAVLTGEKSGIRLEVCTDRPGVHLYSGNNLDSRDGKDGAVYAPRCSVCLETQQFPNAVNQSAFPSPVLRAGEEYRCETVWKFTHV